MNSEFTLVAMSKQINAAPSGLYKSFSLDKPIGIPETFHVPGTYVIKHTHESLPDMISYRIYHCIEVDGIPVWYRLPSIRSYKTEITADIASVNALRGLEESLTCNSELKELLVKINKYFK